MKSDLNELNKFVMDCFRAVQTGRCKIGGLGYVRTKPDGCIGRGRGRNVKANRDKTDRDIPGYLTVGCMRNAPSDQPGGVQHAGGIAISYAGHTAERVDGQAIQRYRLITRIHIEINRSNTRLIPSRFWLRL